MAEKKNNVDLPKPKIKTVSLPELKKRLQGFEQKYDMTSEIFYQKATAGLLVEKDDYITWLGHYEASLRGREKQVGSKS